MNAVYISINAAAKAPAPITRRIDFSPHSKIIFVMLIPSTYNSKSLRKNCVVHPLEHTITRVNSQQLV
jgi:hypothetical protein